MNEETEVTTDDQEFDSAFDEFAGSEPLTSDDHEQPRDEMGRFASPDESDTSDSEADPEPESEGEDKELSELDRAKQQVEDWQHRYNSDLGRQTALQRKIDEQQTLITQLQTQVQGTEQAPENPDGSGMTDAEWAAFREDFPDAAKGVERKLADLEAGYQGRFTQQQKVIEELQKQFQPMQAQAQQQYVTSQYQLLEQQHPDYKDVAASAEFTHWLNQQPRNVQQLMASNDAADAAYLLSTYKHFQSASQPNTNELQQRRQRQLESSKTIPAKSARKTPVATDDFDAAFDHFAEKVGR